MEDDTPEEDGPFSANSIGQWSGEESSYQGTDGELEGVNFSRIHLLIFPFFFQKACNGIHSPWKQSIQTGHC